ncbi:MAG: ATP-dependent Clp protease proteolytic subunit [Clostridia bacterium]
MPLNKERIIEVNGKFTMEMSRRIVKTIDEMAVSDPTEAIVFKINSNGGSLRAAQSIIEAIKATSCEIITFIPGTVAASCAAILFLQGNERIMLEGSELLFHEPVWITSKPQMYSYTEFLEECKNFKKAYKMCLNEINRVVNLPKKVIAEKIKEGDYILSAKEAKKNGAATRIIKKITEL